MHFNNQLKVNIKKTIMILFVLILEINVSNSQNNNESNNALIIPKAETLNNKLGFAWSLFSGYGLSYEFNVSDMNTIEFTASIQGEGESNKSTSYLVATLGTEFQRNMFKSGDSRFYAFGALSYWIDNNTNTNYNYSRSTNENTESNEHNYIVGLGLGWEITLAKRIVLNLEGGYSYRANYFSGTESTYDNTTQTSSFKPYNRSTYNLGFGLGLGFYYAF